MPAQQPQVLGTNTGYAIATDDGALIDISPGAAVPTFPKLVGIGWPVDRAPKFQSLVQPAVSGKETAIALETYGRDQYTVTFNYLSSAAATNDWAALLSFFKRCQGRATPFHFVDMYDCARSGQLLGIGSGAAGQGFCFVRSLGSFDVNEPVFDVTTVMALRVAGVPVAEGGNWSLLTDPNWAMQYAVQFGDSYVVPEGAPVTADFCYAWPCRFDEDFGLVLQLHVQFLGTEKALLYHDEGGVMTRGFVRKEDQIDWTPELCARLAALWMSSISAAEVGRALGVSKNAVVGKAHRLKLPGRPSPLKSPPKRYRVDTARAPTCLWPHGHPGGAGFRYCGKRVVPGKPYCHGHAAIAYVPRKGAAP